MTHGLLILGLLRPVYTTTTYSVSLRLYRPGYELVAVSPGKSIDQVRWKKAEGLAAQEKVLDGLFVQPINVEGEEFASLESGSASAAHRRALLFGASEYDRLALLAQDQPDHEFLEKLWVKAQQLRDLAEK